MQSALFLNGCILMLFGAGLGYPYWLVLVKSPDRAEGFRVAHLAITMGGILVIALSGAFNMIALPPGLMKIFVGGVLCTGYGFAVSTSLYAFTGNRGLVWKKGIGAVIFTFMSLGGIGAAVAGALLLFGVYRALTG